MQSLAISPADGCILRTDMKRAPRNRNNKRTFQSQSHTGWGPVKDIHGLTFWGWGMEDNINKNIKHNSQKKR